jgi:hypothetical protein
VIPTLPGRKPLPRRCRRAAHGASNTELAHGELELTQSPKCPDVPETVGTENRPTWPYTPYN